MKIIKISVFVFSSLFAVNSAMAVGVIKDSNGKQKIGVVSATGAYTLDGLTNKLAAKADAEGATSMKIIAAGGENKLYGVAEIYK